MVVSGCRADCGWLCRAILADGRLVMRKPMPSIIRKKTTRTGHSTCPCGEDDVSTAQFHHTPRQAGEPARLARQDGQNRGENDPDRQCITPKSDRWIALDRRARPATAMVDFFIGLSSEAGFELPRHVRENQLDGPARLPGVVQARCTKCRQRGCAAARPSGEGRRSGHCTMQRCQGSGPSMAWDSG